MELFYLPVSPYSHKVQAALALRDIEYIAKPVYPSIPEQRAAYREMYPLGKLPVLKTEDRLIPESGFIVEHLDGLDIARNDRLIPENTAQSHRVRTLDRMADCYLTEQSITTFFQNMRPEEHRDGFLLDQCRHRIQASYRIFEEQLAENDGKYLIGDQLSVADLSLLFGMRASYRIVPFDDYAGLCRFYETLRQMPIFQSIEQEANEGWEIFTGALQ